MNVMICAVLFVSGTSYTWHQSFPESARRLDDSSVVLNLASAPREQREACGWYNLVCNPPKCEEGYYPEATGYVRTADGYERTYRIAKVPEVVTKYSVRAVIRELKTAGKWSAVREMLKAADYYDEFIGSNYLSTADEDFKAAMAAIVASGVATKEEVDAMLAKCEWTAD